MKILNVIIHFTYFLYISFEKIITFELDIIIFLGVKNPNYYTVLKISAFKRYIYLHM